MSSAGSVGIITSVFLFIGFFASLLFFKKMPSDEINEKFPHSEI